MERDSSLWESILGMLMEASQRKAGQLRLGVLSLVDSTHTATQLLDDAVVPDNLPETDSSFPAR